jgi:phytoene desaturase
MGGTGAVVEAWGRLFRELGGCVRLSTRVRQIVVRDGAAAGVITDRGEQIPAGAVVSNADVANTYRKLLPERVRPKNTDRRFESMRYSMSLFVLYFGTSRQYPHARHHTIILSERYRELLADIFKRKHLAEDFSIYLHRPTATDPATAPPGCDCFYALIPVPNQLSGIDWRVEAKPFRDRVMRFLEARYLPGLGESLVTERLFTPLDFETELDSYLGAGFSVEPIFRQSAWFRPHNASEDVERLFLVGAGTHPGAGMPGVLCSAKIAENLICERLPL